MSDNIKENQYKIKLLKEQVIYQLKNCSWSPNSSGFYNSHFNFQKTDSGNWRFTVTYSTYNSSSQMNVADFISSFRFWILRIFYVEKSLKNYNRIRKEAELAGVSTKFFEAHKSLNRDNKLNQLLNEK